MKKINKKTLALLIAAALLLTITVSGTVAYLVDSTGAVKNVFEPGYVTPGISEEFTQGGSTKSNVKITNTGNVDAYIRAMIVVTWQDASGNVYPKAPVQGTDYTITGPESGWSGPDANGFYYYNPKVASGNSTTNLITTCSPKGTEPDGYTLHVEILAQAVQADGWASNVDTAQEAFAAANAKPSGT